MHITYPNRLPCNSWHWYTWCTCKTLTFLTDSLTAGVHFCGIKCISNVGGWHTFWCPFDFRKFCLANRVNLLRSVLRVH